MGDPWRGITKAVEVRVVKTVSARLPASVEGRYLGEVYAVSKIRRHMSDIQRNLPNPDLADVTNAFDYKGCHWLPQLPAIDPMMDMPN